MTASARLEVLVRQLKGAASDAFRTRITHACAAAATFQVREEFEHSVDPYGTAWKPLAYRKGKILVKTGTLRSSFVTAENDSGFSMWSQAPYFRFHQLGTGGKKRVQRDKSGRFLPGSRTRGGIPARPMMPTHGVPESWGAAFNEAADWVMQQQFKRAA